MALRLHNDSLRYGVIAQGFHWAMAVLVFAQFGLGWYMQGLPIGPEAFALYNLHKSLGLLALLLLAGRFSWRLASPPRPCPRSRPRANGSRRNSATACSTRFCCSSRRAGS